MKRKKPKPEFYWVALDVVGGSFNRDLCSYRLVPCTDSTDGFTVYGYTEDYRKSLEYLPYTKLMLCAGCKKLRQHKGSRMCPIEILGSFEGPKGAMRQIPSGKACPQLSDKTEWDLCFSCSMTFNKLVKEFAATASVISQIEEQCREYTKPTTNDNPNDSRPSGFVTEHVRKTTEGGNYTKQSEV